MIVFTESSAVAAWLLGEPTADEVIRILDGSTAVLSSELTLVECDRVLIRAAAVGHLPEAEGGRRRAQLATAAASWHLVRLDDEVLSRARRPFPIEPIRTLDALHLASALVVATAVPDLVVLSLDDRVRSNAQGLGLRVAPATSGA